MKSAITKPNSTRWNGILTMLSGVLKNHENIYALSSNMQLLTEKERSEIRNAHNKVDLLLLSHIIDTLSYVKKIVKTQLQQSKLRPC